jgi:hypothetical protein|tara:strand:- start:70 stop:285 length:216 start_codon:yes stop_codon:yes gene_type:complete
MPKKDFYIHNTSGATRVTITIIAIGIGVMSLISGYFVSISINLDMSAQDPLIDDIVRSSSIRAVYGESIEP